MQILNILSKQEFTDQNGELKKLWHKIGIIKKTKNSAMYLQLFQFPGMDFYVVEPKTTNSSNTELIHLDKKHNN